MLTTPRPRSGACCGSTAAALLHCLVVVRRQLRGLDLSDPSERTRAAELEHLRRRVEDALRQADGTEVLSWA